VSIALSIGTRAKPDIIGAIDPHSGDIRDAVEGVSIGWRELQSDTIELVDAACIGDPEIAQCIDGDITSATSDAALGPGTQHPIPVSGATFLSTEPYASGVAPVADLATGAGGAHLLLLGFPGEGIAIALTLDASGRIVRETSTNPGHLITRGFAYPEK